MNSTVTCALLLTLGCGVSPASGQTVQPYQAHTVQPVQGHTVQPVQGHTIQPVQGHTIQIYPGHTAQPGPSSTGTDSHASSLKGRRQNDSTDIDDSEVSSGSGRGRSGAGDPMAGMNYRVPSGWESAVDNGTLTLVPRGLARQDKVVMLVLPPKSLGGKPMQTFFEGLDRNLRNKYQVEGETPVRTLHTRQGYDGLYQVVRVSGSSVGHYQIYTIFPQGSLVRVAVFMAGSTAMYQQYKPALSEFLNSMTLASHAGSGAGAGSGRRNNAPLPAPKPRESNPKTGGGSQNAGSLTGTWYGLTAAGQIEMRANGTYAYNGSEGGRYRVSGSDIYFTGTLDSWDHGHAKISPQGNMEFHWTNSNGSINYFAFSR